MPIELREIIKGTKTDNLSLSTPSVQALIIAISNRLVQVYNKVIGGKRYNPRATVSAFSGN